jgi:heat shock protein HslJ
MRLNRLIVPLRIAATVTLIAIICGCQPTDNGEQAASAQGAPAAAPRSVGPPSLSALQNATYVGIAEQPVTLVDGDWRGEPFVEGGTATPRVGLARDFRLTGDLNGDGIEEAVVMLWANWGGSGTFDYLAVMGRDESGPPLNLATAALGDRVKIRAAELVDGQIIVDAVQAGPDDAACCPGQKMKRSFVLEGDLLTEVSTEDMGRQSLADLAGVEWLLIHFNRDDEVPDDVQVTLIFDGDQIGGSSGCNRYSGSVTEGMKPGALTVNIPMATTMMACPAPADEIERRYLEALQHVRQYSFLIGRLALTWRNDDQFGVMVFDPR